MTDTITKRIRMRQGDSATAKTKNEVLRQGEAFWETDTGDIKVGDGETRYNNLLGLVSESKIAQAIANGTYMGQDLSVKFAAEIAAYNGDVVIGCTRAFRPETSKVFIRLTMFIFAPTPARLPETVFRRKTESLLLPVSTFTKAQAKPRLHKTILHFSH